MAAPALDLAPTPRHASAPLELHRAALRPRTGDGRAGLAAAVAGVLVRLVLLGVGLALALSVITAVRAWADTGPDVSNYQHPNGAAIDWNQVRSSGSTFTFIKATEGPSGGGGYYTNPWFASDWSAAGRVGLLRGAYHFAQPQYPLDSALAQARYFVSVTGTMQGAADLPPVLDLETTGGLPPGDLATWTSTWLQEVQRLTGRRPIIYTGYYFWNDSVGSTAFSGYRLWMARYTSAPSPTPLPMSWSTWSFWQFTDAANVPGIVGGVDLSRFCCPSSSLLALGSSGGGSAGNPFGFFDTAIHGIGSITVGGWAIDPDTSGPVDVAITVDGVQVATTTADATRVDVGAAYPGWGDAHGFSPAIPVGPGNHEVCVTALNQDSGSGDTPLGCRTVISNPIGSLDVVSSSATGQILIAGWAADPDATGPTNVDVYVDGKGQLRLSAGSSRADVGAHAYSVVLSGWPPGVHTVCTYAINVGDGTTNTLLGCRQVTVVGTAPMGSFDSARPGGGGITVGGWALSPTTATPIAVHVYVDQTGWALTANGARNDVAAAFPMAGSSHGFSGFVPASGGTHVVCVYAIDPAGVVNPQLGCRIVTVASGSPVGSVDSVTAATGTLTVSGWAIDPDTFAPVGVSLVVDGDTVGSATANLPRPDLTTALPPYGPLHGYSLSATGFGGGAHRVCVIATDVGPGSDASIGCRTILMSGNPFGSLDAVTRTGGSTGTTATAAGWAIDPDTTSPVTVVMTVDGTQVATTTANGARPDLVSFGYGVAHGFSVDLSGLTSGTHKVCAVARDIDVGVDATLGCATI
jgi:GH25 family lysozyme M1 (1,4-beta-N-acetylmuramidase)